MTDEKEFKHGLNKPTVKDLLKDNADLVTENCDLRIINNGLEKQLADSVPKGDVNAIIKKINDLQHEINRLNVLIKIADELITNENAKADWEAAKKTRHQ